MSNELAIAKAAALNKLPKTRSQQKLVGEISSDNKGLSVVNGGFAFSVTVQGVEGKTIDGKGIDIIGPFLDSGYLNPYTGNITIGDGVIYTGGAGKADEGCTITVNSESEINVNTFRMLIGTGAVRLTEAIVRTSGDKSSIQVTQPFTLESLDFRGADKDKLNMGIVKGQALSQDNVLGPVPFPEDTVVGSGISGLSYKLLSLAGDVSRTVIIELYFDNYTNVAMLLRNLLLGDRLKKEGV